ncbi:TPA: ead/Ea22-like family protein [Klebsiella pneumoniae]|nr:ead/Ea22-like family protein [Klebsiella pneumoniae]
MTDITELAQSLKAAAEKWQEAWGKYDKVEITIAEFIRAANQYESIVKDPANVIELVEALEKAQQRIGKLEKKLTDHKRMNQEMAKAMLTPNDSDAAGMEIAALRQRIAGLEREQEQLRPVGVMSEKAFHRLENSECRFIALWPRPGIFLQRKRPEDGVLVYARTAAAAGIKVEAD